MPLSLKSTSAPAFFIASLKHTNKGHEHIVWWAKDSNGYTPVFGDQVGRYGIAEADELNDGVSCLAVPVEAVEALLTAEPYYMLERGDEAHRFYDQRGRVVDNTKANWQALIDASPTRRTPKPKFHAHNGARRSFGLALISDVSSLRVTEGVSGLWHYHMSEPGKYVGLCGAPTMNSALPISEWGQAFGRHLPKAPTWCRICATARRLSDPAQEAVV